MRNLQQVRVRSSSGFEKICPFPIGYIYMSTNSTSPASTYGGTWSALTDRKFLRPSGSWNSQGGSDTNRHNHWMPVGKENGLPGFSTTAIAGWSDGEKYDIRAARVAHSIFLENEYILNKSDATETTTYGTTISTVPSYRTCYAWYRTA